MKVRIYVILAWLMVLLHGMNVVAEEEDTVLTPLLGLPTAIDHYIDCFAIEQSKFNPRLKLVAKNAEAQCGGKVTKLALLFELDDKVDIPYARKMITYLVGTFIDGMNAHPEKFQACFTTFPLTLEDVVLRIRVQPNPGYFVYPSLDNIASITSMDGVIIYGTLNSYTYAMDSLRTESYAQAVKMAAGKE